MATNGIDFVIGGKDQAKPAMSSVEKSLERLEKKTDSLGSATNRLAKVTGALVGAYAAFKGVMAMIGGLDRINAAYDQQTEAVKGLEVALGLQGASVSVESARLQKFAGDMQKLTGVGDELTLAMMKQASMMGVATEDLDDMAKAAIGLGEVMGTSAESGMEMMRRAQEGNFMQFQRTFPAIAQMTTNEEKLAFVTAMAAKGLEAKALAADRVSGMSDRASGAVGDLMESVGALLAPVRILISAGIKTLAESLQTLLVPAVAYAEEVLKNIGPLMEWVKEKIVAAINGIIGAFTFFEVILTNLDSVWAAVVAQAELSMLQIGGAVMHALTEVIPGYAAWFAENFVNLIRDGLNIAYLVTTQSVTNIIDAFNALWEFIASGGTSDILGQLGEIAGRSYLENFESSLTDLPDIAARTITDREKDLAETIGQVGANLGDEFSKKFNERIIKVGDGLGDEFSKEIDLKVKESAADTGKGGKQSAPLQASQTRLLTRGTGSQMMDQTNKILEQTKKHAEQLAEFNKQQLEQQKIIATNTMGTLALRATV
ncbi:MAG TPA: hypothetical protein VMX74_02730 [Pirellulales bacterium]|nr:hypothetical protein [Pirellulales bacterium]